MKVFEIDPEQGFKLLAGTVRSQAATMVLAAGKKTGGPQNTHGGDQWLFVLEGAGQATVGGETAGIRAGSLVLIAAGEPHEISNRGNGPLKTLSFYAPPEF